MLGLFSKPQKEIDNEALQAELLDDVKLAQAQYELDALAMDLHLDLKPKLGQAIIDNIGAIKRLINGIIKHTSNNPSHKLKITIRGYNELGETHYKTLEIYRADRDTIEFDIV